MPLLENKHSTSHVMEVLHMTNKGRLMDTVQQFYMYKETKNCNQIDDKNNVKSNIIFDVYKKNQLDVTFCILYFSSNSCSTCFWQPCAHHQELTTA